MGLLMRLMRKLFHRLSRHKPRRDEDLQGRPAQPEAEAVRARVAEIMLRHYADRTKNRATPRRRRDVEGRGRRSYARSDSYRGSGFGNPRWMRGEGVTPYGISSRAPAGRDQT
jgi:hypothetical protein